MIDRALHKRVLEKSIRHVYINLRGITYEGTPIADDPKIQTAPLRATFYLPLTTCDEHEWSIYIFIYTIIGALQRIKKC